MNKGDFVFRKVLAVIFVWVLVTPMFFGVVSGNYEETSVLMDSDTESGFSEWNYDKEIIVKENSDETLTDYQVLLELDSSNFDFSGAQPDGSDLRFTTVGAYSAPTEGLVAYYPFDGNANDQTPNGNNGTEQGGLNYVSGVTGQAASFDGVDDLITIPTSESMRVPYYTASFWLKTAQETRTAIFSGQYDYLESDHCGYEINMNHGLWPGAVASDHMTKE